MTQAPQELPWSWLGKSEYTQTIERLEAERARILAGESQGALFIAEHPPVITLGRNGLRKNIVASAEWLAESGIDVVRTTRGGDVTYHGPGQLMIYPVVKVPGVRAFVHSVAGALAAVAAGAGAHGAVWSDEPAGLWIGSRKLAACGVHVHRGVTTHGFAFNISTPQKAWAPIVPCGLRSRGPVSLSTLVGRDLATRDFVAPVADKVCAALARRPRRISAKMAS